ncbi:MAG: cyclase/dehydrase [Pedosphaera sp.]|nr:cyclase/dehydrase [Pedosphaera sp.]
MEWDAVIINEHPNNLIAWESTPDSEIKNAGSVRFEPAPAGQGTEVTVSLEYVPPAGKLGAMIAKLYGEEPELQVEDDLNRFKALMETGEIPTTEGQPVGGDQKTTRRKRGAK